jgi:hypothetical protein
MGVATRAEEQGPRAAGMRLRRVGACGRHAALLDVRDSAEAADMDIGTGHRRG